MPDEDRHTHAGRGELDLRVEDLLGLDHHLPFFLGRPIVEEDIDMRDHVEGDLFGEDRGFDFLTVHEHASGLIPKLIHSRFT